MPLREESENMFYSFDVGPIHFVAMSTEFYYFLDFGIKMVEKQYHWIKRDLQVNKEKKMPQQRERIHELFTCLF